MTQNDSMPQTVRHLVELVTRHGLTELTVQFEGVDITIRGIPEAIPVTPTAVPVAPVAAVSPVILPAPAKLSRPDHLVALEAPMVGVFYRSPSPDDPPFVVVGDRVAVGDPIGMIEAMKVFSEVPAEVAGRVAETPVESGKLVQQGQPLLYVEPA